MGVIECKMVYELVELQGGFCSGNGNGNTKIFAFLFLM